MTIGTDEDKGTHLLGQYYIRVLYLGNYPLRSLRQSLADSHWCR